MTQFGYMSQNRVSLFKCCARTMNFSGTQLKYDLRDSKAAWARAVLSQHLGDRIENALNAADPLEAKGWMEHGHLWFSTGGRFVSSQSSSCLS